MKLKQRLFAFQRSGSITLSPRIFWSAFLTKNLPDEKSIHELPPALIATPAPRGARLSAHGNLSKRGRGWSSANVLTAKSSAQRRFTLSNRAAEAIQDELYDLKSSPQGLIRIVGNYGNPLTSNTQKRNEIIAIRGQSQWHHGREPASDVFAILVAQMLWRPFRAPIKCYERAHQWSSRRIREKIWTTNWPTRFV